MTRFERFNGWRRRWISVTSMLFLGLGYTMFAGDYLLHSRFANASWRYGTNNALFVAGVFWLLWLFLGVLDRELRRPGPGSLWILLLTVCWVAGLGFGPRLGAVTVVCVATAALMWQLSRGRRPPCPIAVAGWLWAGIYPLTLPWPNEQRFFLGMALGGVATALQGILDVVSFFRGRRPEWSQSAATPAG